MGGQWPVNQTGKDSDLEWDVIQSDLGNKIEFLKTAAALQSLDRTSRESHQRILFVPTFYAIGLKKA